MEKSNILVVEDESIVAKNIESQLKKLGYTVLLPSVASGEEAVQRALDQSPDLVLMDINLAGKLDGIQAGHIIQKRCNIPVIYLTAFSDENILKRAGSTSPFGYILKPFRTRELHVTIEMALAKHATDIKLQRSEERYRQTIINSPNSIFSVDKKGFIKSWNKTSRKIFGYKKKQVSGSSLEILFEPSQLNKVNRYIEQVYKGKSFVDLEIIFNHNDNYPIYTISRLYPIYDEANQVIECVFANIDITERVHMEEALRHSEERYRNVVEQQTEFICRFLPDRTITFVNEAFCRLSEKNAAELIGSRLYMTHANPYSIHDIKQYIDKLTPQQPNFSNESTDTDSQGNQRWYHWTTHAIFDQQGHTVEYQTVGHEITDLKRAEKAILSAQKLAHLGTLAAGVAHEINSPLQVITGASNSLLNRINNPKFDQNKLQESLTLINRNAWRVANIIQALLTYSRPYTRQVDMYDLNHLITETLNLIELQPNTTKNIQMQTSLSPDLPLLYCDQGQISQALMNIIENAEDAIENSGEITIRTQYDNEENQILLEVQDTGCGIPNDILERVLDPFFTTKPLGKGSGMGLSIAQGIVKAHNGKIEIKSQVNEGTSVLLYFPINPTIIDYQSTENNHCESGRYDQI